MRVLMKFACWGGFRKSVIVGQSAIAVGISLERRVYPKYRSYKKSLREFRRKSDNALVADTATTVYKYVELLRVAGPITDRKKTRRSHVPRKKWVTLVLDRKHFK